MLNEHRRRHGLGGERRVEREGGTVRQLALEAREQLMGVKKAEDGVEDGVGTKGRSEEEERLRAVMGKQGRGGSGEG